MLDLVPLAGDGGKWQTVIGSLSSSASARVAEIAEASAQGGVMTAQQVLEELSKFASANMLDWSKLGRDQTAALIEVTRWRTFWTAWGEDACEVRRAKFGLANKIDALHLLG